MKILWYVNIVMPDAAAAFNLKQNNAGGWLIEQSKRLSQNNDIALSILNVTPLVSSLQRKTVKSIKHMLSPILNYALEIETLMRNKKPDIVHILAM